MEHNLTDKIDRLLFRLVRDIGHEVKEVLEEDLTLQQFLVMQKVAQHNQCNVKDIADELGITLSAASLMVDKMAKSGYIMRERSEEDRRLVWLSFSQRGQDLYEKIATEKRRVLLTMFQEWTDSETETVLRLLEKLDYGKDDQMPDEKLKPGADLK